MSGYVVGSVDHFFCRKLNFLAKPVLKFGYRLAIICAMVFALHGGVNDHHAEAKAKYFSGKTSHSRAHHRSSQRSHRKHISGHKHARRHYQGSRVKYRGFSRQRHRPSYHLSRKARHKRHGKFAYQPRRYHGASIIHVHKVLSGKRAHPARAGYRQHQYRRHHRDRYHRINRVVINGAAVTTRKNLYRHIERDDATGISVIYFDKKKCDQGYDCVMRLGLKRSSAKIIVVGTKRQQRTGEDHRAPRIIYPPN